MSARAALFFVSLLVINVGQTSADEVSEFYKDKPVTMIVGNAPGGGNDNYARITARNLGRFIPGNPTFVVQNMPGAGGLRAAAHMYNVAPKDGATIALIQRANLTGPLLDSTGRQTTFDMTKFNWLGSINSDTGFVVVWHTTPHFKMEDLSAHELIVGSANPTSETIPYFLNNIFGAKIKIVSGYKSGVEIIHAMERGEVQARILGSIAGPWPMIEPLLKDKKVRFLATLSLRRSLLMPEVPLLKEFAKDDAQAKMLELLLAGQLWGRPFLMPPGVPEARAAAMRVAFEKMTADYAFLQEADKMKLDIELLRGEEIQEIVKRLYALPPDLIEATKKAVIPH